MFPSFTLNFPWMETFSYVPGVAHGSTPVGGTSMMPSVYREVLENGLEIVVIPDHRAPIVTHMAWYRVGSVEDPLGRSGLAHFLEHLMFKGTRQHPAGAFSTLIAELGGQENAFTGHDYTAYYQKISKQYLPEMMAFEADRMTGLILDEESVVSERDVVLEERHMMADNNPAAKLQEALYAALFVRHPYGTPILGWEQELKHLTTEDALTCYHQFYTPENCLLVVAGDVTLDKVVSLAKDTYGKIPKRQDSPPFRLRPQEPEPAAHRRVTLVDEKVEQEQYHRIYLVPSHHTAAPKEAEALLILSYLLGGGMTSVLYKKLVMEQKLAAGTWVHYDYVALDSTTLHCYAMPLPGVALEVLEEKFDDILQDFLCKLVPEEELQRTKTRLRAEVVYAQDNHVALAQWFGSSLTTGRTIQEVQSWAYSLESVTAADVQQVGQRWLLSQRSVTGFLLAPVAGRDPPSSRALC